MTGNPTGGASIDPAVTEPSTKPKLFYPLIHPAEASFLTGGRNFGAPRGPVRKHAGVDLLAPYRSPIRAIANGVILQLEYDFYEGTNALDVHFPGVGVVRYGEISSLYTIAVKPGEKVEAGQTIAYVGQLDGSGASMIHFELYSGKAQGPLTVLGAYPFERRSDLVDPSSFVDELYKATFG